MSTLIVPSSKGKDVGITLLGDWSLIVCIPVFILSVIGYFIIYPVINVCRNLLLMPGKYLLLLLDRLGMLSGSIIITLNMTIIAVCCLVAASEFQAGIWEWILPIILLLTSGMAILLMENYALPYARMMDEDFSEKHIYRLTMKIMNGFPAGLLISEKSRAITASYLVVTVYVVYCIAMIAIASVERNWFFWSMLVTVISFSFSIDFEMIEHIAAHSPGGKLLRKRKNGVRELLYIAINELRRYVVWNFLAFWQADRYYYTHTLHHHIENNGPADWQSTLRFDQTSFLDYVKSIVWYTFASLIPFETARYFGSLGRQGQLRGLLLSQALSWLVYALLFYMVPLLGGMLVILNLIAGGFPTFFFVHRWHGFHDRTRPYDIEASNNFPDHYAHHKRPTVHIFARDELAQVFEEQSRMRSEVFHVFRTDLNWFGDEFSLALMRSLLWQGKLGHIRNFISGTENEQDDELGKYVMGCELLDRSPFFRRLDDKLSKAIGSFVEKKLRGSASTRMCRLCYGYEGN